MPAELNALLLRNVLVLLLFGVELSLALVFLRVEPLLRVEISRIALSALCSVGRIFHFQVSDQIRVGPQLEDPIKVDVLQVQYQFVQLVQLRVVGLRVLLEAVEADQLSGQLDQLKDILNELEKCVVGILALALQRGEELGMQCAHDVLGHALYYLVCFGVGIFVGHLAYGHLLIQILALLVLDHLNKHRVSFLE